MMFRKMHSFRRLGRGTKPNINDQALPNLPKLEAIGELVKSIAYGVKGIGRKEKAGKVRG